MLGVDLLAGKKLAKSKVAAPRALLLSSIFRTLPGPMVPRVDSGVPLPRGTPEDDRRAQVTNVEYKTAQQYSVIQRQGKWLDQSDLDVLLHLFHLFRKTARPSQTLGSYVVTFSASQFLTAIGRSVGGSGLMQLRQSLDRLYLARVTIISPAGVCFKTGFVETLLEPRDDDTYGAVLNVACLNLFADSTWTGIVLAHRLALRTDLAKWLHGEFSVHQTPIPRKLADIATYCGRPLPDKNKLADIAPNCGRPPSRKNNFVAALQDALADIQYVTGWKCWLVTKGPDKDMVYCDKTATAEKPQGTPLASLKTVRALRSELPSATAAFARKNKTKLADLDAKQKFIETDMTAAQLTTARLLRSAAATPAGLRGAGAELPLLARQLDREIALYVLAQPAEYPALREHVRAAHAALMSGLPAL